MTTAMSLDGPWTGLRAFPRGFRTPDSRQRMEAALQRLQDHRERFDRHIARAQAAVDRIDRIVADGIARLDASDPDADLEADGSDEPSLGTVEQTLDIGRRSYVLSQEVAARWEPLNHGDREEEDEHDEPSLCGVTVGGGSWRDLEAEHDGREPDADDEDGGDHEASLCGVTFGAPFPEMGLCPYDGEAAHDGREPDPYDEPSLTAADHDGGNQSGGRWIGGVSADDREAQCDDDGADGGQ